MLIYRDRGLSGTRKSSFCVCFWVWCTAVLPRRKGSYFLSHSGELWLNHDSGAGVKRESSPAHKASLKWVGIPEITHSNPSRAASSLQLSKVCRVQSRGCVLGHGVSLTESGARRKAGGCQLLPTVPCQTSHSPPAPCSPARSNVHSSSPEYFKWRWRNH